MQTLLHPGEHSYSSLGRPRGISDLARFAGNPCWASAETECPLGTRAYPSPPMPGSPPLPPKPIQEAGDRVQSSFQAPVHDVYRPGPASIQGGDARAIASAHSTPPVSAPSLPQPSAVGGIRPFPLEAADRPRYPASRPDEGISRPLAVPHPQPLSQPQYPLPPVAGPMQTASPYSLSARPPTSEGTPYTSPKSQRKTKGHVASACVPCKRAHLR